MVLLAQLSDLHLDGTARTATRAARAVEHLRALPTPPDALLVTGDIADHGALAEYELAARLLDLPFPVLTCPGNHDVRAAFREGLLGEAPSDRPINRLHLVGGLAVLMCDVTVPGRDEGVLSEETREWIDEVLGGLAPGTPSVLAFHQPPVPMHHPLPDEGRLREPERLAALVERHPGVVAVITGHAHTAAAARFAGRPLVVGPATTWTLRLPWEGPDAADRDQPPALAYHVVKGGELTTHFRVLP
ncbi:metallophosphoesterase [Kitasatospora terrestris]|uniref:Metallophosphoesterase n=1 Tax=Kitasatospora terrestris TaxID=258051 RepID=A0ABP9EC18_9ACTN